MLGTTRFLQNLELLSDFVEVSSSLVLQYLRIVCWSFEFNCLDIIPMITVLVTHIMVNENSQTRVK